jgi:hypothetical protein
MVRVSGGTQTILLVETSGSHGGVYEDECLLGRCGV